jgi:hypothetical protein
MVEHGWVFWVAQGIAVAGFIAVFWSNYSLNRTATVAGRGVSALLFCTEYVLLGAWGPAGVAGVNTVRAFSLASAKTKVGRRRLMMVFIVLHTTLFVFVTGTFSTIAGMIPIFGAILSTIALSMEKISTIKALTVISSAVWISYFLLNGLWVNLLGDTIGLVFAAVAWVRATRAREQRDWFTPASERQLSDTAANGFPLRMVQVWTAELRSPGQTENINRGTGSATLR